MGRLNDAIARYLIASAIANGDGSAAHRAAAQERADEYAQQIRELLTPSRSESE